MAQTSAAPLGRVIRKYADPKFAINPKSAEHVFYVQRLYKRALKYTRNMNVPFWPHGGLGGHGYNSDEYSSGEMLQIRLEFEEGKNATDPNEIRDRILFVHDCIDANMPAITTRFFYQWEVGGVAYNRHGNLPWEASLPWDGCQECSVEMARNE